MEQELEIGMELGGHKFYLTRAEAEMLAKALLAALADPNYDFYHDNSGGEK